MITRRHFLLSGSLFVGASLVPGAAQLAHWLQLSQGNMQLIRRNVGFFTERGGTIGWLLDPQGIVVVDTQFPEQAGHLIEHIRQQSQRPFDLLINTHHHGDHTGGNIAFKDLVGKVVGHTNCLSNHQKQAKERNAEATQLFADTTFDKEWSQRVGDELITARYFGAGHTNGDIVVHFENANVAHVGDLMFNRRFPYIDRPGGANIRSWIQVLRNIRKTYAKDTIFIFGHAADGFPVTGTHADLKAFENYLSRLLQTVQKAIKAGQNKEQVLAITTIPGAPEWKGDGIQRSLTAAWEELGGK